MSCGFADADAEELELLWRSSVRKIRGREHICKICQYVSDGWKMRRHLRQSHMAGGVHTCPVCSKTYKTEYSLSNHMGLKHKNPIAF